MHFKKFIWRYAKLWAEFLQALEYDSKFRDEQEEYRSANFREKLKMV